MSEAEDLWRRLQLADRIGSRVDPSEPEKGFRSTDTAGARRFRDLSDGTDASNPGETGWAVLYGSREKERAEPHLAELIQLRRVQAGDHFRELVVPAREDGSFVSGQAFLFDEIKEAPGVVDIKRLPYYVLIVASPKEIPWEFQFELAINRAVGRLYFDDARDYARYAAAIKAVEAQNEVAKKADPKRTLGFFFVERKLRADKKEDKATPILDKFLFKPVTRQLKVISPSWDIPVIRGEEGRVRRLQDIFEGRAPTGAGWVVLSHGAQTRSGSSGQAELQGGITCLDGRVFGRTLDIPNVPEGVLLGKAFVLTACFGAGTTRLNEFKSPLDALKAQGASQVEEMAPFPFVAKLPQRLLAEGALGIFGHVGKGLTASYRWMYRASRTEAARSFNDMLVRILRGQRLGHAMRPMARRASNISSHLLPYLRSWMHDPENLSHEIERQWSAWTDARNFVLLGDPAARSFLDRVGSQPSATSNLPTWPPPPEPTWEKDYWQVIREVRAEGSLAIRPLRWTLRPVELASEWDLALPDAPKLGAPALQLVDGGEADLVIRRKAPGRQFRNAEPPEPGYWQIKDHGDKAQSPPVALNEAQGRKALQNMAWAAARAYVAHRLSELKTAAGLAVDWRLRTDQGFEPFKTGVWIRNQAVQFRCRNQSTDRVWMKLGVWSLDQAIGFQDVEELEPGGEAQIMNLEWPDFPAPYGVPRPERFRAHLVVIAATDPGLLDDLTHQDPVSLLSELEATRLPSSRWLERENWSFHIRSVWYEL